MNYVGIDIGSTASKVVALGDKILSLSFQQDGAVRKL